MNIRDFYSRGIDTKKALAFIKEEVTVAPMSGPMTIKTHQNNAMKELGRLNDEWTEFLNSNPEQYLCEAKKSQYEKECKEQEGIVDNMEGRARTALTKNLINNSIIAFGYKMPVTNNNPSPEIIYPDHWPHLTINYENDEATAGNTAFRSIRFLTPYMLEQLGGFEQLREAFLAQKKSLAKKKESENSFANFSEVTITLRPPIDVRWTISGGTERPSIYLKTSGLVKRNDKLNQPGEILFSMAKGVFPKTDKRKPVSDLRRIIQRWLNTDKDPFCKDNKTYRPRFTLILKKDDEREQNHATLLQYDDSMMADFVDEDDPAGDFIRNNTTKK